MRLWINMILLTFWTIPWQIKELYSWHDVAKRTEIVYDRAIKCSNQNLIERLPRYAYRDLCTSSEWYIVSYDSGYIVNQSKNIFCLITYLLSNFCPKIVTFFDLVLTLKIVHFWPNRHKIEENVVLYHANVQIWPQINSSRDIKWFRGKNCIIL